MGTTHSASRLQRLREPVEKALDTYRTLGAVTVGQKLWLRVVYNSPLYGPLERVLGEQLHEKLIRAPLLGYWPRIEHPQTYNEYTLHRKLHTDNDLYAQVADKWAVRDYVRERVGDEILNEVYHITVDPETIPFEDLPDQFVIKATHGSGWNIIVEDKATVDFDAIREQCQDWLSQTFGERQREYWYNDIPPRILIERYIDAGDRPVPRDYKFFVFDGVVEYMEVDFDRMGERSRRFFDREGTPQEFRLHWPVGPVIDIPDRYDEMVDIAEMLGADFDFVRVDLYNPPSGEIIFGELTLAHASGGHQFYPRSYDFEFGSYC